MLTFAVLTETSAGTKATLRCTTENEGHFSASPLPAQDIARFPTYALPAQAMAD